MYKYLFLSISGVLISFSAFSLGLEHGENKKLTKEFHFANQACDALGEIALAVHFETSNKEIEEWQICEQALAPQSKAKEPLKRICRAGMNLNCEPFFDMMHPEKYPEWE